MIPRTRRAVLEEVVVDVDAVLGKRVPLESARETDRLLLGQGKALTVDRAILDLERSDHGLEVRDRDPEPRPPADHFPPETDGAGEIGSPVVVADSLRGSVAARDTKRGVTKLAEEIVPGADRIEIDARALGMKGLGAREDETRDRRSPHAAIIL
jgi:hypothetical protein